MSLQQKINRITDILRRDDGISGAMHYTEQTSWILFLKFLDDYEAEKVENAILSGKKFTPILDEEHHWSKWACPKTDDGKLDIQKAKTGSDLSEYVNDELFPYLKSFRTSAQADSQSFGYKIGSIFEYLDNKIASGHTMREVLDIIDSLNFQSETELFELSQVYEGLLQNMGDAGGYAGEFYTPRALVRSIVNVIDPQAGQTIYDAAAGSCGFLIDAFEHIKQNKNKLTTKQWDFIQNKTFFGFEKTSLAYVMGMMNMILHGIESPNLYRQNTLTQNIRDIQEKDRYDIILANPPFGGKEKAQIQQNFPIQSNATELLFLQHFMKSLKLNGKAAIIVPEGVLFQTSSAFKQVKQELLEHYNLHTILSLPAGVFLPYSGVKTNVLFFDRSGGTTETWFYECEPSQKLTKNKPLNDNHLKEFVELYFTRTTTEHSWMVPIEKLKQDYDLSAKNPAKQNDIEHMAAENILELIKEKEAIVTNLLCEIEELFSTVLNDRSKQQELPDGWEWKTLGSLAEVVGGGTPKTKNPEYWGGEVVWLSPTDLPPIGTITHVSDSAKKITEIGLAKSSARLIPSGSVVFSTRATIGKIAIADCPLATNQGFTNFICPDDIYNRYLAYVLVHFTPLISDMSNSTTFKEVSKSNLKQFEIPIPPISEQRRIVDYLDALSERVRSLETIGEERQSYLTAMKASLLDAAFSGQL